MRHLILVFPVCIPDLKSLLCTLCTLFFLLVLRFALFTLLTDSLYKVVLLMVSPYKKGLWWSGHPTVNMESLLSCFVCSYPLQTTNSPFLKPVTYRHICETLPAHGGKALSHVSPERGRAALVGQTCALAAWTAFLTAGGRGDAFEMLKVRHHERWIQENFCAFIIELNEPSRW